MLLPKDLLKSVKTLDKSEVRTKVKAALDAMHAHDAWLSDHGVNAGGITADRIFTGGTGVMFDPVTAARRPMMVSSMAAW